MNKAIALIASASLALLLLAGCSKAPAEEPALPADNAGQTGEAGSASPSLTGADKLKALALGETAVWRDYTVTVLSVDRADGKLTAHVQIANRGVAKTLGTDCLLSFGMPPIESSFEDGRISVPSNGSASGTLTFDDQYGSQRLFWNDGATEATWLLDLQPADAEPASADTPSTGTSAAQKQAIAALEAEIPSLIANNTFYEYRAVDSATATVTPLEDGGYEYVNDIGINDGAGNPATAHVVLRCEPNGNCIGMTIDGAQLF